MSKRPKIHIEKEFIDSLIEGITYLVIFLLIAIPAFYYNQLPDKVPTHFDAAGNPDDYGSKQMIWLLPVIGIFLFAVLHQVTKYPHTFNYLKAITEDNALRQYTLASRLMRALNLVVCSMFCYITWQSVQVALARATGLGHFFLIIFLAIMTGVTGYYIYVSDKSA